ncbi:MAG: hypothetical protein ABFQ89_02540 [Chloroflexota bacterium]
MPKPLRTVILIHVICCIVLGLPLFIKPSLMLNIFDWSAFDPIMTRCVGAALLAIGWLGYRVYASNDSKWGRLKVEVEVVFTALCTIGFLRHLLTAKYSTGVWIFFAIPAIWMLIWLYFLFIFKPAE